MFQSEFRTSSRFSFIVQLNLVNEDYSSNFTEVTMKNCFFRVTLAATLLLIGLPSAASAQPGTPCSTEILSGTYAFTISGQIFHPDGTVDNRQGVAITHFYGWGGLSQNDFVVSTINGKSAPVPGVKDPTTGFNTAETGTYQVNPDCTGNMEIDFPAPPGETGAVIKLMFVLSDNGNSIHTVVSSLTPPGASAPVAASIRSEGRKITVYSGGQF